MAKLMHWIFGCRGYADHERDGRGVWWFGLRCKHCGKLSHRTVSNQQDTDAGRAALEASR